MRFKLRLSQSFRVGPFKVRVSEPIIGGGRVRVSEGMRTPLGWLSATETLGGKRRRRRG